MSLSLIEEDPTQEKRNGLRVVRRKGRRMGVVLSTNKDINLARQNADDAASKIKVRSNQINIK